jgi:hypothetical protein
VHFKRRSGKAEFDSTSDVRERESVTQEIAKSGGLESVRAFDRLLDEVDALLDAFAQWSFDLLLAFAKRE